MPKSFDLALSKRLCNKRQIMRKTSSRHFPECFVQLFFSHFEPTALHNAKFWATTHLFSAVADPPNTRRESLTALRKLPTQFLSNPPSTGTFKLGTGKITMTARDVTGNRAIFSTFWGHVLTKLHSEPGEKGKIHWRKL